MLSQTIFSLRIGKLVMKILYCSYSQIPSHFANSIAVMKQCDSLNSLTELRSILINGCNANGDNVFSLYGVKPFPLILLPKWVLRHNEFWLKVFVLVYAWIYRPDVVYSRDILLNDWLCRFHINNICEIHQLDQENYNFSLIYKKILRRIMEKRELQAIVCISKSLAEECLEFGVPKKKLAVLHSGIDLVECANIEPAKIPDFFQPHPLAAYVGSLQKGKGIELILQMAELAPDINFLIVGGSQGQISESKNLKHIPQLSHKKALSYMKAADFLLLPLTEQSYKFHSPLKLFEYMAMGKTVIASDNVDIREIITPLETGMLADSTQPEDFIKKIKLVYENPQLKKTLEENSKRQVTQFTWKIRSQKIIALVRGIKYGKK